jgi:Alginate export
MKIKTTLHSTALFAATLLAGHAIAGPAKAPEPKKTDATPAAPAYAPITLFDGKLTLDIQEKMRLEIRENNFDFNSAVNGPQDASWLLQRFRLGLGYQPTPWLKIYAQGQDVRELGGSRPNTPGVLGAEGDDVFDLLKAYIQFGDTKKGLSATVGRQFLSYGDQRLVGPLEWLNQARTFDAIKLRYAAPKWQLDLFTSSPVVFTPYQFNKSQIFDQEESASALFSGAYLSTQLVPFNLTTDLYLFNKRDQGTTDFGANLGDSDFWTVGTLWKGDPKKLGGWDYDAEMAFQAGEVNGRDLTAFAGHWGIGYNWLAHPWKPRLAVQYNYGSGDQDPTDGDIETFQNLYPTNHLFYGFMDTTGWINMHNPQINFSVMPTKKLKVMLDYHLYWNATNDDAWRRVNGVTAVRPLNAAARNAGSFRGHEFDLTALYKIGPHVGVQAGYSLFVAGDYLADTGASDNAHFGYLQVQIDF